MQITSRLLSQTGHRFKHTSPLLSGLGAGAACNSTPTPLVCIKDATFYRRQPSATPPDDESLNNPPLFPNLSFEIAANDSQEEHWAIIGPSNAGKTTLLEILRGQHICLPPNGRKFPYLSSSDIGERATRSRYPSRAIQYVGFGGPNEKGLTGLGTYISARYESRRESTDFSLLDYLKGNVYLNPLEAADESEEDGLLERVIQDLELERLIAMPVNNLSNGQSRRARIAKALLGRPELLLLDEPFMGLDPPTTLRLSPLLHKLAQSRSPRLLLALRPQDLVPDWISHVAILGGYLNVTHQGKRSDVVEMLMADDSASKGLKFSGIHVDMAKALSKGQSEGKGKSGKQMRGTSITGYFEPGDPVIVMEGVQVQYNGKIVLGDWKQRRITSGRARKPGLHWTVHKGQRWGLFGANGSGKTTLLSIMTSDHPQAYSNPLKVFGRRRLPSAGSPGISLFELQSRMGHSSPEVHAFFPRHLTVRQCVETAYADTPLARPVLTSADDARIDACLRWFQAELNPAVGPSAFLDYVGNEEHDRGVLKHFYPSSMDAYRTIRNRQIYEYAMAQAASIEWADNLLFGQLSASAQKVALFLRAIVKSPEVVILDEAFSGLDDMTRDKCLLFLEDGEISMIADPKLPLSRRNVIQAMNASSTTTFGYSKRDLAYGGGLTEAQALIVVSHLKEELPMCIKDWIFLPEAGEGQACRIGSLSGKPLRDDSKKWNEIWGV